MNLLHILCYIILQKHLKYDLTICFPGFCGGKKFLHTIYWWNDGLCHLWEKLNGRRLCKCCQLKTLLVFTVVSLLTSFLFLCSCLWSETACCSNLRMENPSWFYSVVVRTFCSYNTSYHRCSRGTHDLYLLLLLCPYVHLINKLKRY